MIISRYIHTAADGIISFFLWLRNIPLYVCTTSSLSSPLAGHVGCFHVLAIVNKAAVNAGIHASFRMIVFSRYMPRSGLLEHMVVLGLVF